MKMIIKLVGVAVALTIGAGAETPRAESRVSGTMTKAEKQAQRRDRPRRMPGYDRGTPITAGDSTGVRIDRSGGVLFNEH